jgi:hypothetical protein
LEVWGNFMGKAFGIISIEIGKLGSLGN